MGERYERGAEHSGRRGRRAAFPIKVHRHPAAGGSGAGGAADALPLLRGCAVGERDPDRQGRCAGHHLPGVPLSRAGKAEEGEKEEVQKETGSGIEAEAGSDAPQKGEADSEHCLHHPAGGGQADQGRFWGAADHQDQHLPRRPGRGSRRCGPQLRQAERMARRCAGPFGPLSLP